MCRAMAASSIGVPAGMPSITMPMAGPWDSPKIVRWKCWPKLALMCVSFQPSRDCPPSEAYSAQKAGADLATACASEMAMSPSDSVAATAMAITMR